MKKYICVCFFLILALTIPGAVKSAGEESLPAAVRIKTSTQTFNRYYYFALKDGRIFFKPNTDVTGKKEDWKPFLGTGLPDNRKIKQYPVPSSITQIHADADEIVALSDTGRFYWLRLEKGASWDGRVWNHLWGWPEAEPLFLKRQARSPRVWAIGRRNKDVLYHEDIDGNQHHYGTMGITTLYVLTADGREIRFTDSGLPADFSHTITLPDRGRFVAENMSVSASTIFVIDASGKMYTRLVDFDTIGSDPMFFKYSYLREKREGNGHEWNSNFTEWSLPAEGWLEQPSIELNGQAQISSMITILQNGRGNAARELRVAGKNAEGQTGYFHKPVFGKTWVFSKFPLTLEENRMLSKSSRQQELSNNDIHYYGKIREKGKYVQNTSVELVDFNLSESPSTIRIVEDDKISEMKLHTVEAWTYLKRDDPGRDGTAKVFLGTLEIPDGNKSHGNTLKKLKKHNLQTFRFIVEATREHVYIKPRSRLFGDMEFIVAARGVPIKNSMFARTYAMAQNGFEKIANADELKIASFPALTRADIPLLRQKINMNREAIAQMNAIISEMKDSSKKISQSSVMYKAFYTIVHATGLFLIDKPKIWTATRHFGTVLKGNKESSEYLYFTGKQNHDEAVRKINNRIKAYTGKINALDGKSSGGFFFSENYADYFRRLGLSNSEPDFINSGNVRVTCDVTPVSEGQSFFFIHLGHKDETELLTFMVRLPDLEDEINRQMNGRDIVYGKYKARICLFENNGSKDADLLYERIFSRHLSTRRNADEIKALLTIDKNGWQLYDVSGFRKNQVWIKYKALFERR